GCGIVNSIDWIDNFAAPFVGSAQYPDVRAIAGRYPGGDVVFTGHSKGGHNALYALANSPNPDARAVAFGSQGFPAGLFAPAQAAALRRRGVNYVVQGDLVGALMHHPERRVFVRKAGDGISHALSSLTFDEDGHPTPGRRPLWSYLLEWATRMYLRDYAPPGRADPRQIPIG
ncbi:MAG: DUF2974 domain-containing protein, partial [Clostridiales bacterium]|nr:DUF2974 domain-containing protein [Clostridiales bacterium]